VPWIILPDVKEDYIVKVTSDSIDHFPRGVWWSHMSTFSEHAPDFNTIEQQVHLPCAPHEVVEVPYVRVPHQDNVCRSKLIEV